VLLLSPIQVEIYACSGTEMMAIRAAASKHIFSQLQKGGSIGKEVKFDASTVDYSDINPTQQYYKGLYFESSTATALATLGSRSSAADASHCEGKGRQSYGTVAATVVYDSNRSINPVAFEHFISNPTPKLHIPPLVRAEVLRQKSKSPC
jgi:hypothetical protein